MSEEIKLNIIVADNAPVVLAGFSSCLKKIQNFRCRVIESISKNNLLNLIKESETDLLIVNPTFGGILNPQELRKISLNPDIKIFAIEMGRLSHQVLSLYDDHLHVTDDIETITEKIKKACSIEKIDQDEEKETLSCREKEIVSYVVKGFTNQEIADKLFLSIHTVITHRRNIAKKLEIHSATGLTIYAIVNKIVDLSEIKL